MDCKTGSALEVVSGSVESTVCEGSCAPCGGNGKGTGVVETGSGVVSEISCGRGGGATGGAGGTPSEARGGTVVTGGVGDGTPSEAG